MLTNNKVKACQAYAISIDKRLVELKRKQSDPSLIAHSLWECMTVLQYALHQEIKDLEYEIYFELIARKIMEYGLGNFVIADISLRSHLDNLLDLIEHKKKNYIHLNPSENNDRFTLVYNY